MTVQILLIIGFAVTVVLLFLPRIGLVPRYRRWRALTQRERLEDALKHLLDLQWNNQPCTSTLLQADLRLSPRSASKVINELLTAGFIEQTGEKLALTAQGERLALQVARAHRLWERYLADEARMPLKSIHREAHRKEHSLSPAQVDALDTAMGYPQRDPHGDPIPGRLGSLPNRSAHPLDEWQLGTIGRVTHIEDEPPAAYTQILAEGIRLDQRLRVIETSPDRLILSDGQRELHLARALAANIHLEEAPDLALQQGLLPLHSLKDHQPGEVVTLDERCQGFTRRRFLDLGITPGAVIMPELLNSFGDPRAYRIRGTLIALRRDQAEQIWVRPLSTTS